MAFKRTYPINETEELYVSVLVECENCGYHDIIKSIGEIEYVDGMFHNTEDISSHDSCAICESDEWSERGEYVTLGTPKELHPSDHTVLSLESLVNASETFVTRIRTALENDFYLDAVDQEENTIALRK